MARQFRTPIRFDTGSGSPTIENADGSRYLTWGSGAPEGSTAASTGSLYLRTDGATASTLYIKESGTGNTGWVAIGSTDFPLEHTAAEATDQTLTTEVTGDTQLRFILTADGKLQWGSGAATPDISLYREAADTLTTDDILHIIRSASSSEALGVKVSGDSQNRFYSAADGKLWWGTGAAAQDTNLYRDDVDSLKTDGTFEALVLKQNGNLVADLTHTHALDNLSDVTITTATSGQALTFDGAGWVNTDVNTSGTATYVQSIMWETS